MREADKKKEWLEGRKEDKRKEGRRKEGKKEEEREEERESFAFFWANGDLDPGCKFD